MLLIFLLLLLLLKAVVVLVQLCLKPARFNRPVGDAAVVADLSLINAVAITTRTRIKMAGNAERVAAAVVVALGVDLFHTVSTNLNSS